MLTSTITGPAWQRHLKSRDEAVKKREEAEKAGRVPPREKTTAERRKEDADTRRRARVAAAERAEADSRPAALVTPGTDSYWAAAPELTRTPKFEEQDHGIGTIMAIEGLVELGMTPSQAIVAGDAATARPRRAGSPTSARSSRARSPIWSCSPPTRWPTSRTSARWTMVFKDGRAVDRARLPEVRVLSVAPPAPKSGTGQR